MRVSNNMNYEQVKNSINKNRVESAELQNQAATMKRITKPSDDPVGAAKTLGLRTDNTNITQFTKNIDAAKAFLGYTESSLGDLSELLIRAKELAISQASDASSNAESRLATASEIDQMFKDAVAIGNRRFEERYIFGGYKTTHSPFDHLGEYHGDHGSIKIEVAKGVFASVNLPGDKIFLGRNAAMSTVPENARGSTMPHYPESPSQAEDKESPLPGQKPIDVRAPASIDESEKLSPEEKTANSMGRRRQLDQDERIHDPQPGQPGENVFNIITELSTGLRANDTMAVQDTLERLDTGLEQVVLLRAQVGARMTTLENTGQSLGKNKIDNSTLLSSVEDADAFEVFTDITKNENTLKATLQTSGKLIQPSLLDFLR